MNKKFTTSQITLLGLMIAILLLMAYTPLGYLNIGPLAITFNIIPVAISAITMGPVGGAIAGAVFGLTSFGQCIGIGGTSIMGATLFGINPFLAFVQRFIPRLVDGLLLGYIFQGRSQKIKKYLCFLCSDRLLLRISEHFVLYGTAGRTFRKYRVCAGPYGRKKCNSVYLHICRNQRSMRDDFRHCDHGCCGSCPL